MVEDLYRDFKKKVEKKLKIEVKDLIIKDENGKVTIEVIPVTHTFSFGGNTQTQEEEVTEEKNE